MNRTDSVNSICVVDFMNVFVRAWMAGTPSAIHAVRSMLDTVANVVNRLRPEFVVVAFDGGHVFRSELYPQYKSGRPEKDEDMVRQLRMAETLLESIGIPTIRVIGWEADDVLGSFATLFGGRCTLITGDKDALQCLKTGCRIYHPWGRGNYIDSSGVCQKYKLADSRQFCDYLALNGDSCDGIPGVFGIGPVTAAKLLNEYGDLESILEAARVLKIGGKTGKILEAGAESARLSKRLVELKTDLPIGDHWFDWPCDRPRKGWKEKLQSHNLGSIAEKLGWPSWQFGLTDSHKDVTC